MNARARAKLFFGPSLKTSFDMFDEKQTVHNLADIICVIVLPSVGYMPNVPMAYRPAFNKYSIGTCQDPKPAVQTTAHPKHGERFPQYFVRL